METSNLTHVTNQSTSGLLSRSPYTAVEIVFIVLVAGSLSLVTVIGNILVMVSIKVNRNLQTVNNYFLFSLACADLIIGLCSMNLYTVYIVIGYWPLGPVVCDLWLAVDYVVSNASVMNLLIISFDRYFCVTKPLSYPVRRSTKMAGLMIAAAWVLSFILWAPAILFWQFIVGGRTVPSGECYIQFFSNAAVTFGTAIAAFYLPVAIMIGLYWRISRASRSRVRKDSRKTSGTSMGDCPSQSQDDPCENAANDCNVSEVTRVEEDCGDGEKNKEMVQQLNGIKGKRAEKNSTNGGSRKVSISVPATTNREEEEVTAARVVISHWRKRNQAPAATGSGPQLPSLNPTQSGMDPATAAEKQSLVIRTLLKAAKRSPEHSAKKKASFSREKKVTRTIMAILVAFVATWTPYNVMVLINTFCSSCIPNTLWTIGYWLCYINSTINPACYALCNVTFKNTFKHLLLCQYNKIRSAR